MLTKTHRMNRGPWWRRAFPGIWVTNPGGGGSFSGVITDSSLQGNGTSGSHLGIKTVGVTARLTGAGTGGSPLDIAGWPLTFFSPYISATDQLNPSGVNRVDCIGFALPHALTFSHIHVFIKVTDAVNLYDLGIYTQAGVLVANIGAQSLPTVNDVTIPTVQGAQTIPPGLYLFAFTGNATTVAISTGDGNLPWAYALSSAASSGGALPASISAVAVAPQNKQFYFFGLL